MVSNISANPLVHVPLYCTADSADYCVMYLVELLLVCLESYFTHQHPQALLVTTNDSRVREILLAYKGKSGHDFELRFVSRDDLLAAFDTDESRLRDSGCLRTVFSKFYPILNPECLATIHVDIDTMFMSKVDFHPLLAADIGLVDENQFGPQARMWHPNRKQMDFFRISPAARPVAAWINTGVFAIRGQGFDICRTEINHYLENLERAIADGIHGSTDESIMNALAVREPQSVRIVRDYRYNFLAYYLERDPNWRRAGKIVHFHSLKPYDFYFDGIVRHRCDPVQAQRINPELYLAVLIWCGYLHAACQNLNYDFPMVAAMPRDVVEKELRLFESICLAREYNRNLSGQRSLTSPGSMQTERVVW
ncbi:MAG TPA: hypothetical protein VE961_01215 [Pyrinomonadaceae bacterium]|nr:hypothetical protein [Pyrinomonadaceae bacterium]